MVARFSGTGFQHPAVPERLGDLDFLFSAFDTWLGEDPAVFSDQFVATGRSSNDAGEAKVVEDGRSSATALGCVTHPGPSSGDHSLCAATTRAAGWPDWMQIGQTCAPPSARLSDRADVEAVTTILTALVIEAFWRRPEVFEWADEAYQRFAHVDHPRRHELIGAAGWASWALGDVQECLRRAHEAVDLRGDAAAIDELPEWAEVGGMAWSGHAAEANDLIDWALSRAQQHDDRWLESILLSTRALDP